MTGDPPARDRAPDVTVLAGACRCLPVRAPGSLPAPNGLRVPEAASAGGRRGVIGWPGSFTRVDAMGYRFEPVTAHRGADLAALSRRHGTFSYCSCMRWRLPPDQFRELGRDGRPPHSANWRARGGQRECWRIWDGDLPGLPTARTASHPRERVAAPGPDGPAGSSRPVDRSAETRHRARTAAAPADRGVSRPAWPESPARAEPSVPAPRTPEEIGHAQPGQPGDVTAAAREPRAGAGIAVGDMHPDAEPADDDPAARWPAPNPRAARITSPPGRQGSHVVAESRETERAGPATETEAGGTTSGRPAVPPDWRDQVLAAARQPWQPGPRQPRDSSPSISPERQAPSADVEPDA